MDFIKGLDDELIPYYYDITHRSDYLSVAASDIDKQLPGILKKFGVDSCHFIAHSKGGLDALEYLQIYYPSSKLEVLSLTTLSSPLQGTAHADILAARDSAAQFIAYFKGFPAPFFVNLIANFFDVGAGEDASNLTTWFVFLKMAVWMPLLGAYDSTSFDTVSADMELNSDKRINCFNREAVSLAGYVERFAPRLTKRLCIVSWVADRMYQILLKVSTVRTRWRLFGGLIPYLEVTAVPTSTDQENDVLVTIGSGRGNLACRALVEGKEIIYNGWAGRTHVGVIQAEVAPDVVPWLVQQEQLHGDMRPF